MLFELSLKHFEYSFSGLSGLIEVFIDKTVPNGKEELNSTIV